jgi:hypothetical protein
MLEVIDTLLLVAPRREEPVDTGTPYRGGRRHRHRLEEAVYTGTSVVYPLAFSGRRQDGRLVCSMCFG